MEHRKINILQIELTREEATKLIKELETVRKDSLSGAPLPTELRYLNDVLVSFLTPGIS